MSYTTTYDVRLKYAVDNQAARAGTRGLTDDLRAMKRESAGVTEALMRIGAAAAGAMGLSQAKRAFIDFNSEVQNARISMAAMFQGAQGGTWDQAKDKASALYQEFQRFSTQTPVTTQEIVDFSKGIMAMTFSAGGATRDLKQLTEQGVIAAKVMGGGHPASYYATELNEMLAGNVRKTMMFANQLLSMGKISAEEFNALSGGERIAKLEQILNSDSMKNAAHEFGDSWDGVTSTLKDKLQILLGKVGQPLFAALTREVKSWNKYLDDNAVKIDAWANKFASGLVTAFDAVKSAVGFLVDHADTLLTIGKVWAAVKIGQGAIGMLGGGAGSAGGLVGRIGAFFERDWRDTFDSKSGGYSAARVGVGPAYQAVTKANIGGSLPVLGQALSAGLAIGTVLNEWTGASHTISDGLLRILDPTTHKFYTMQESLDAFDAATRRATDAAEAKAGIGANFGGAVAGRQRAQLDHDRQLINLFQDMQRAQSKGSQAAYEAMLRLQAFAGEEDGKAIGKEYRAAQQRLATLPDVFERNRVRGEQLWLQGFTHLASLRDVNLKSLDQSRTQTALLEFVTRGGTAGLLGMSQPQNFLGAGLADLADRVLANMYLQSETKPKMADKPNVNITIQRIEVQSEDPDRYAFGLVEAFRDAVKNPSAAVRAVREG